MKLFNLSLNLLQRDATEKEQFETKEKYEKRI